MLVDLFDQIETFFKRLETYVNVRLTEAMKSLIVKIMTEILGILAIATKEIKQGLGSESACYVDLSFDRSPSEKYLKKLIGRTDIEDVVKKLEKLANDEARMVNVQVLETTDRMENKIDQVADGMQRIFQLVPSLISMTTLSATQQIGNDLGDLRRWLESHDTTEEQMRQRFQQWLSPPDPSINYNTASNAYQDGTAVWFTQDDTFHDWKASGSGSLLWIHGKRMFLPCSASLFLLMPLTLAQ
jgi:hypothetical protein